MKTATFVGPYVLKYHENQGFFTDPYSGAPRGDVFNVTTGEIRAVAEDGTGLFIICTNCWRAVRAPNVFALLMIASRHEQLEYQSGHSKGPGWPSDKKMPQAEEPIPDWELELLGWNGKDNT